MEIGSYSNTRKIFGFSESTPDVACREGPPHVSMSAMGLIRLQSCAVDLLTKCRHCHINQMLPNLCMCIYIYIFNIYIYIYIIMYLYRIHIHIYSCMCIHTDT